MASLAALSLVGRGSGVADENAFQVAKSARGTFELQFMPRVQGTIPTASGTWQMQWRRIIRSREEPERKELWSLSGSGAYGMGTRWQSIELEMQGGAGSGSTWSTQVPGNSVAGTVKMRVHVQFNGGRHPLGFTTEDWGLDHRSGVLEPNDCLAAFHSTARLPLFG